MKITAGGKATINSRNESDEKMATNKNRWVKWRLQQSEDTSNGITISSKNNNKYNERHKNYFFFF